MKKVRVCSFCGNTRVKGVSILKQWMCSECEEKLVTMNIEDPQYHYNMDQIKDIWKSHYILMKKNKH